MNIPYLTNLTVVLSVRLVNCVCVGLSVSVCPIVSLLICLSVCLVCLSLLFVSVSMCVCLPVPALSACLPVCCHLLCLSDCQPACLSASAINAANTLICPHSYRSLSEHCCCQVKPPIKKRTRLKYASFTCSFIFISWISNLGWNSDNYSWTAKLCSEQQWNHPVMFEQPSAAQILHTTQSHNTTHLNTDVTWLFTTGHVCVDVNSKLIVYLNVHLVA